MAAVLSRGGGDKESKLRQTDRRTEKVPFKNEDDQTANRTAWAMAAVSRLAWVKSAIRGQRGVKIVTFDLRQATWFFSLPQADSWEFGSHNYDVQKKILVNLLTTSRSLLTLLQQALGVLFMLCVFYHPNNATENSCSFHCSSNVKNRDLHWSASIMRL